MKTADLLERDPVARREATWHSFLSGVHEGTLARATSETWPVQDYPFLSNLLFFQSRLLARVSFPVKKNSSWKGGCG